MNLSIEKLDNAIRELCDTSFKIRSSAQSSPSSVLQKANACVCIINSHISMPSRLDEMSPASPRSIPIQNCESFNELLKCVPPFLIRLISDFPLLTSGDSQYWYERTIQSVYLCFRSLRVQKVLQINVGYFHDLLRCTSGCLAKICDNKRTTTVLLLFLRIVYACLSGLPINTVEPTVVGALVSYFNHESTNVQLSARNAAQFFIPYMLDESNQCWFLLSSKNVCDLLKASGKDIPISSSLKLFHAYGQLPQNRDSLLKNGVHLYAAAIMFKSTREIERQIAFSVLKMLFLYVHVHKKTPLLENTKPNIVDTGIKHTGMTATADTSASLTDIVSQLSSQTHSFKRVCLQKDASGGKEVFQTLEGTLRQLEDYIFTSKLPPDELVESKDVRMLLNITAELLESLTITDENQLMRWTNLILFKSWHILKQLHKQTECLEEVSYLIDKVLVGVTTFVQKKTRNEITFKSVSLFVDVLEGILYDMKMDRNILPLAIIKKCLIDLHILKYHPLLTLNCQVIICSLVSDADSEILTELCVEKDAMVMLTDKLKACDDPDQLLQALQKFKALAKIPENRALLRQCEFLVLLESFSEKYADSDIEGVSAELICTLLSDPPDEVKEDKQSPLHTFDRFISACFEGTVITDLDLAGIEQLIATGTTDTDSDHNIPNVVVQHATYLYQVMFVSHDEFNRVLYSSRSTDVAYLVAATKLLKNLCIIYEDENQAEDINIAFEKQVVHISKKYLPELACISFKALSDSYSDSFSDLDKEVYFNSLMPYLLYLHFAIERWSRMDYSVKNVLVNYGAFHLLLNELHSASTTKIITDDILYNVLTSLYNILLEPSLAKQFRICVTKKLFKGYIMEKDAGIRCLAQFCFSCMHMIQSRSEQSELCISQFEANMLAGCLCGVSKFFGGHDNLITTIGNLAHNPSNLQFLISAGIVSTLKLLASCKTASDKIFNALLNMIPKPRISDVFENNETTNLPLTNAVTVLLTSDLGFMKQIQSSAEQVCKGLSLLLCPPHPETSGLGCIQLLYSLERYADCFVFCTRYLASVGDDCYRKNEAQLYQAKCMFHEYNCEIQERIERGNTMPGFKYMEMMRKFCNKRILRVINTLTNIKEVTTQQHSTPDGTVPCFRELYDNEAAYMLDKALLDSLVFNTRKISTCLLCHRRTQKLIHSHYIPKSILVEFVKALGLDPGMNAFIFSPTDHPSDWHFKSVGKFTFSMLCKTCDGEVLSKDENLFKSNFFNIIYGDRSAGSLLLEHSIPYSQYLYKFAAGLLFRCMAPLYSGICTSAGNFLDLHVLMQSFREIIFSFSPNNITLPKVYLLFLPSKLPSVYPPLQGWSKFVFMNNSPYGAYKLLRPGQPMVPNRLCCFMVKIGIMVFVVSFDEEVSSDLEKMCPFSQIQFACQHKIFVPKDQERHTYIPEKLWWSLFGWAKKEMNSSFSVGLSVKAPAHLSSKFQPGLLVKQVLESKDPKAQPLTANLLPPGFELNFENPGTLPENVIVVPRNGTVLLHYAFKTSLNGQGYAAIVKLDPYTPEEKHSECCDENIYSVIKQPCILVYLEDAEKKLVIKTGFTLDENCLEISDLPGVPTSMKDSHELRELTEKVPDIIHGMLRCKGFRSLKSLLFWHENGNNIRANTLSLDTRCISKRCIYCEMRCDSCLQPCLDRFKVVTFPNLGNVQCCSDQCSSSLFPGTKEGMVSLKTEEVVHNAGKIELMYGYFTIDDQCYSGLKTAVQFSVFQTKEAITGLYSIPPESLYIKLWFRSIHKPLCIEYTIDDDFTAIELLNLEHSQGTFSIAEEREMMTQLHEMLVKIGVPYHFAVLRIANPA